MQRLSLLTSLLPSSHMHSVPLKPLNDLAEHRVIFSKVLRLLATDYWGNNTSFGLVEIMGYSMEMSLLERFSFCYSSDTRLLCRISQHVTASHIKDNQ